MYTDSFCSALSYAAAAHRLQHRKGSSVPYISHLLGVAAIVLDAEGDETEATAAVLHDVVEDQPLPEGGGRGRLDDVKSKFGNNVAAIVEALSDWVSADITEKKENSSYIDRKTAYHEHLRFETDKSVLLVSAADKLHNARAMESDFDKIGDQLWKRFNGTREQILWNYYELIAIYYAAVEDSRRAMIVDLLAGTVERLRAKSGSIKPTALSRGL
jgi:(p)ppGpp synthase/HD superfamily hydrolase